jgi:uncharacterized ion transporter superfamily protein YfcC
MSNVRFKLIIFLIYTIFYECLVWGLIASAIYFLHWSEWFILLGILMSGSQLRIKDF